MATPQQLLDKTTACIEWYWTHGVKRTDPRYELRRGTWLDRVYRCRNLSRSLVMASEVPKPCMALWGPSQTGKSTLLSGYIDKPDDDIGLESALTWHPSDPVRFVVGRDKSSRVTVLNPFNFGADASGCVSRFSAQDQVPDPLHPVEIVLASDLQILHALAVGYLSECEPRNSKGEVTSWDSDSFKALIERMKPSGPPKPPTREGFEFLQSLAETIDLLVMSEAIRYPSLKSNWQSILRAQLLDTPWFQASAEQAEVFAFEFLWDSWKSITDTYRRLVAKRRSMASQWGERVIRCSYRVAALLLDIDAFKKSAENPEVGATVNSLRYQLDADSVMLDVGGQGIPLVSGQDDFGLTQGLVWELHFSLNRANLIARSPMLDSFFSAADLMDFPGVANDYGSAERHNDNKVGADLRIALTEVLKRGKTASIVVSRAWARDIDGFSLLMRLGKFPAQPRQLVAGISSWLEAFGHSPPPNGKPMPINLVMTFCANLVNQVIQSGTRQGLQPCFEQLKGLGWLADPKTVNSVATNYPQFNECRILGEEAEKQTALEAILQDPAFDLRFGDSAESFREMFANGGMDYLFSLMTRQAEASKRKFILEGRLSKAQSDLLELIQKGLPGESGAMEERNRCIDSWLAALDKKVKQPRKEGENIDPVTKLSAALRAFVNIDPDELDDIPMKAIASRVPVRAFIERQARNWQSRRSEWESLDRIGIVDGAEAQKLLGYLIEGAASELSAVETFFKNELGALTSRADCKQSRRYLAHALGKALVNGSGRRNKHREPAETQSLLERLALAEEEQDDKPENSPHYISVIEPFMRMLESIKNKGTTERLDQPGDKELAVIAQMP
ncbi:MAG: hypothetical protein EAZ82_13135 [Verrucomicrobia bacterium]|nr:MAG: hypothetical protein EAZ82_13135 [Verrucomicrobiota bacterium]